MASSQRQRVNIKEMPVGTTCEIHDWETEGLGARLMEAMKARFQTGGINVCTPCVERARADAHEKDDAKKK